MGLLDKVFGNGGMGGDQAEKLESASDQSPDERTLVGYIKKKVEEVRQSGSRISHEAIWMTNIAYILGFDSVMYDTNMRQFRAVGRGTQFLKRNRLHINKVLPTVQNRLARLCQSPPKWDVVPNSSSTDDKDAARLSNQVCQMLWDREELNLKRMTLYMWVQQCGHAFMKVYWDINAGKEMVDPLSGEIAEYEGEVKFDVCSPFEVFVDPLAKTLDDAQWVCQAKVRKLDYFKTHYPERGDLVKEEGAWLLSAQYEARINSLNTQTQGQTGTQVSLKNTAIELVYYEKRSKKHPNGRMIATANGVLLEEKELPCGEIPFVKFDDVVVGGKFYSESIVTHLRPVQDQYNRLITMRAAWTNKLMTGKYLVPRGSGLGAEALNDQSGEVLEYDAVPGAPPPQALQIPLIPAYAYKEEEALEAMMLDISGINQVSRGQAPSASMPAIGMQFLEEQDSTRLGVVTEQHERSWAKALSLALKYIGKYYEMPRILKVAGANLEYTVREFVGEDLKGNYDVRVIRGSTVPGSKALRRAEIMSAFQAGLLGDPHDPQVREKVLAQLEFGDIAEVYKMYGATMKRIKQDIEKIELGITPDVSEFDNHTMHVKEKDFYRLSDKFESLDPSRQKLLLMNIEAHIQAEMRLQNPQIAVQDKMAATTAMLQHHIATNPDQYKDIISPHQQDDQGGSNAETSNEGSA